MTHASHRRVRGLAGLLLALLSLASVVLVSLVGTAGAASAAQDPSPDPVPALPPAGHPWFGPGLEWGIDSAVAYADRLGTTPSLYAQRVHYPLDRRADVSYFRQFEQQAASQGAVAVLDVQPQIDLTKLTEADAQQLAAEIARAHVAYDTYTLVRFAPEMNGTWTTWGQQPTAYIAAFRQLADAVHAATDQAAMVWSPAYAAGYPFGRAYGEISPDGTRSNLLLDTNRDGKVDDADDPYGPYWPGADAVDWVGLTMYRFGTIQRVGDTVDQGSGTTQGFGDNSVPAPDEFEQRFDERYGYGSQANARRGSFYQRFAVGQDKPMILETSALYNPAVKGGGSEVAIKQAWWREVFAGAATHPMLRAISWLDLDRSEAEINDRVARWSATRPPELARRLLADLRASGLTLGAVTRPLGSDTGAAATAEVRRSDDIGSEMGWTVFCVVLLAVGYLLAGLAGRFVPSWRYTGPAEEGGRDTRVDLFRGLVIVMVVITHIEVAGVWTDVSLKALGAITGAEMFVLLSGLVLGMVYRPVAERAGRWVATTRLWKRARKLYVTALVVVLLVPVVGLVPFIDTDVVTTFTDRGTGTGGAAALGQVYDLYPNVQHLLDYPPPWYAVRPLLLLGIGPWPFNIMGLYVVLALVLPLGILLLRRGLWWLVLALSWAVFLLNAHYGWHPIDAQFEYVFPLLTWQLPFFNAFVLGWYRARVVRALTTRLAQVALGVVVVAYAAVLGYLWICHHQGVAPVFGTLDTYAQVFQHGYTRVFLQPGRLIDLALLLLVAYAVLTTCWKPIDRAIGWLWTPLGRNSLYVFVLHVAFVIAVASLPSALDVQNYWVGTAVHTVVVLLIWAMVKKRVLFSVIPR